jgi:diguanylate cyclase (GGDEF)-like protein/PAS domain S-box-containing protein
MVMTVAPWRPTVSPVLQALALGVAYFLVASLTIRFTRFEGGVACLWVANAFGLMALLNRPRRDWPAYLAAIALAGMPATWLFGLGVPAMVPMAAVNTLETLVGALLLQRLSPQCCRFSTPVEILVFVAIAGAIVPAVTGLGAAAVTHYVAGVAFWPNWVNFVAAHGLGAVTFAPLLTLILNGHTSRWLADASGTDRVEAGLLIALVLAVALMVFGQSHFPLLFLTFLPMMLVTFRLGRIGAASSVIILAVVSTVCTLHGTGPIGLIEGGGTQRAQFLQFYLATAVLMVLPAAAELTQRKRLAARWRDASALYQIILDRTGDIIMQLDMDGAIRYVSPSIRAIGGYDPDELVGQSPTTLVDPADIAEVMRVHREALGRPNDTFMVEYRGRRADGGVGWFETHTRATVDAEQRPTGVVCIVREVTRRKRMEELLSRDAATDPLTGLPNRRAFDAALEAHLAQGHPAGAGHLAIFDLDHFKSVNDRFGHATGDTVLVGFGELLRGSTRDGDAIGRIGGEEFVALLGGTGLQTAQEVCERIRSRLADTLFRAEDGRLIRATLSVGLAPLEPGADAATVLAAADRALYRAKALGRNRLALAA